MPGIHQYRVGSTNRSSGGSIHDVESYIVHPGFNITDDYVIHDISFVRVKQPFNFSESVQPIKLADKEPKDGEMALISGWGVRHVSKYQTFNSSTYYQAES